MKDFDLDLACVQALERMQVSLGAKVDWHLKKLREREQKTRQWAAHCKAFAQLTSLRDYAMNQDGRGRVWVSFEESAFRPLYPWPDAQVYCRSYTDLLNLEKDVLIGG